MKVKIYNKSKYPNPDYQSDGASGIDLRADIDSEIEIKNKNIYKIPTGIYLDLPKGLEAQVRARSGLALKHGISLVNGIGTVDSDYRGEVQVILTNLTDTPYFISPGERIAQLVFIPVALPELEYVGELDELTETERGEGGFGHSGKS